jgi:hypothetical protein
MKPFHELFFQICLFFNPLAANVLQQPTAKRLAKLDDVAFVARRSYFWSFFVFILVGWTIYNDFR